jgi:hypothetical protein
LQYWNDVSNTSVSNGPGNMMFSPVGRPFVDPEPEDAEDDEPPSEPQDLSNAGYNKAKAMEQAARPQFIFAQNKGMQIPGTGFFGQPQYNYGDPGPFRESDNFPWYYIKAVGTGSLTGTVFENGPLAKTSSSGTSTVRITADGDAPHGVCNTVSKNLEGTSNAGSAGLMAAYMRGFEPGTYRVKVQVSQELKETFSSGGATGLFKGPDKKTFENLTRAARAAKKTDSLPPTIIEVDVVVTNKDDRFLVIFWEPVIAASSNGGANFSGYGEAKAKIEILDYKLIKK